MILESGATQAGTAIPDTLQDLLMARLDRLGDSRHAARTSQTSMRSEE
jgi:hypothetical protein